MGESASTVRPAETAPGGLEPPNFADPSGLRPQRQHARLRWSILVLVGIAAVFLVARVPLMYRQYGGMDEDWFAVPGWTVAQEGIPRVPYAPSRDPACAFYRVDEAMFALPPAYFYWTAPFFLVLPDGYGTARLASGAAGLIAIWLVYRLGRAFYQDEAAGLWAAGLYSVSRVLYLPAMNARPDMLCGALGLAAVLATWHWHRSGRRRYLAASGALLGLGGLAHPFAIVYALQVGVWVLIVGRGWRGRLGAAGILVACTLAVLALWLPLILAYPEAFRGQFFTNVLDRSGPGLLGRLIFPWPSLVHQTRMLLEHAQPLQFGLMLLGLVGATLIDVRRREPGPLTAVALAWSSIYLLAACEGLHLTKGYWCYPGALALVCLGRTIMVVSRRAVRFFPRPLWWAGVAGFFFLAMLPGSGIRTWVAHLRHWSDVEYDAPRFAEMILRDLPPDARLTVERAFVFDAFLAGRKTVLGLNDRFYFGAEDFPYDYLIVSRCGMDDRLAEALDGKFLRAYGNKDDIFACYAEIYVPAAHPPKRPGID